MTEQACVAALGRGYQNEKLKQNDLMVKPYGITNFALNQV